jgi:glyoxalase superfamily protein
MTSHLAAVSFAAARPEQLARFWGELLGRERAGDATLRPDGDTGFRIRFVAADEPKTSQNRAHFDLSSDSPEQQRQTVARALELGARHIDVGQRPEEEHVVLADPEGNEFCVVEGGNNFLAGCGLVGALSCDGSQEVGYFWSAALAWPLVWDQDEETAIQSPRGGPKISWGGPPLMPRAGLDRVRLELTTDGGDLRAEIDRLLSLGAKRAGSGRDEPGRAVLTDPDGTEFSLLR